LTLHDIIVTQNTSMESRYLTMIAKVNNACQVEIDATETKTNITSYRSRNSITTIGNTSITSTWKYCGSNFSYVSSSKLIITSNYIKNINEDYQDDEIVHL